MRKKANITQSDVGGIYQSPDGELYWLTKLESEPMVTMTLDSDRTEVKEPLSFFAEYIKLEPRKSRKKKVIEKKVTKPTSRTRKPKEAVGSENLRITTPASEKDDYLIRIGTVESHGKTLIETLKQCLRHFSWTEAIPSALPDFLTESEKETINGILSQEEKKE